ncbi:MAG: glycosyltransferase family 4 protein [Bacteroidota bacterium]|nr:glycosyltransferase family 4 protein [Bacteroidota bacterium]
MKRLSIIMTHPIQYNAPWIRLLAEREKIEIKVFYTWSQVENGSKFDPGFKKNIEWDIPLLSGYNYEFIKNTAKHPGTRKHSGIINPGLISAIENWKPDAILVNGWNFKSHLQCINYFHKRIPVFFRGDSTLLDEQNGIRSMVRKVALKSVYKKVDYALYVGLENKKYFLKYGVKEDHLVWTPHAIDNERFAPGRDKIKLANEIKHNLNINGDQFVFLYAGKFEIKKDVLLLLDVFSQLNNTNVHLVMVGNGEMESELKKRGGDNSNIHFLDFQNQKRMPLIYQLADVFVLPSKGPGETWGLCVNEAMASGKPVLVSNKCGCATDLIEEGKNGYIFESGKSGDLLQKMELLLKEEKYLARMGEVSLQKIQNWSFEKIATSIENLVLNI